jgi:hypothetical protein
MQNSDEGGKAVLSQEAKMDLPQVWTGEISGIQKEEVSRN